MMTMEGFRRRCAELQEAGMPFAAYWHPHGFGLLMLGPIARDRPAWAVTNTRTGFYRTYRSEYAANRARKEQGPNTYMEPTRVSDTPKAVSPAVAKKWLRLRDACPKPCLSVDFDGKEIKTEGGLEYLWQN